MAAALMAALWLLAPAAANELSIATAGPRTGPQSMFGITWQNGMQMYVDEVNAVGGVKGRTVALVAHDDNADPDEGVSVARKLCDDPATLAVIGHFNSGVVRATLPIYGACGMPIVFTGSNPTLTQLGFANVFRPIANDFIQGGLSAGYARATLHANKAAVVHDGQVFGQGVADIFTASFKNGGGEITSLSAIAPAEDDFRTLIAEIKAQSPDVVYVGAVMPQLALFARQMREQGLAARLLLPDGAYTKEFIDQAGAAAAQGAIVSFQVPPARATPELAAFADAYRARFGEEVGPYSIFGYVFAQIVIEGIRTAATLDRAGIIAALRSIRLDTAVGPIEFDATGELKTAPVFLYEVAGDGFNLVASSQ
jgi:branched-chain amino acid transport system substrate-binding protein